MNLFKKNRAGFTLIELLVAFAIITILASLVLVNYANSQKKSRDSKRKADLESLQQAVYMYKDANEKLPDYSGVISGGNFNVIMGPFIDPLPHDPKANVNSIPDYYYFTNNTSFSFFSYLENDSDPSYSICKIGNDKVYHYSAPKITSSSPCN